MCGITGLAAKPGAEPPSRELLTGMMGTLQHRGPDDAQLIIQDTVGLAATRLAIVDLEGGQQPYRNQRGNITAVFNGELYNFKELKHQLEALGYVFRSKADGEVLVHGFEEWGAQLVERLNGMFAFAIYDSKERTLVLARDPVGVKPLYFCLSDSHFVWGSEVKAILASDPLERRLDLGAAREFLAWEYVPADRTLFQGIKRLMPGQLLTFDLSQFQYKVRSYWTAPSEDRRWTEEEAIEKLDSVLAESVNRQLMSDVPLGAFLSGGVDSSLLLSYGDSLKAFHLSFTEQSYSETRYAYRVAEHLGCELRTSVFEDDPLECFPELLDCLDDPIADTSLFSTYALCRAAAKEVKVALGGDGGDELFGGYEAYLAERLASLYQMLPSAVRRRGIEPLVSRLRPRPAKKGLVNKLKRFVEGAAENPALSHARWRLFVGQQLAHSLFTEEVQESSLESVEKHILELFDQSSHRDRLNRSLWVDLRSYLAENCLAKVDKASMACSLEVRVPMLDKEAVELAFSLPQEYKVHYAKQKILLKKLAARRLPRECVYRAKEGFSVPMKHYLRRSLRPLLEEATSAARLGDLGLFRVSEVERLKTEHLQGRANHSHVLWGIVVLDQWTRRWLKS